MRFKIFDSIFNSYNVSENDLTLMDKIQELESRIIKLEDENISLTNELYRLENSLDARIDILANEVYNLNFKDNTDHV